MTHTLSPSSIGGRISAARSKLGLTQREFATLLGVSRGAVGQWEQDVSSPSLRTLEEIAAELKVSPAWLAFDDRKDEFEGIRSSAEEETMVRVPEVEFASSRHEILETAFFGIPEAYLLNDLSCDRETAIIVKLTSKALEPEYQIGDRVILDRSVAQPHPAGAFAFWDGAGISFAFMRMLPDGTSAVLSQSIGSEVVVPKLEIDILGRLVGRIQAT